MESMNKSMRFSVVIPVYNGEKYIRQSVQSILNQTYSDIELIVIDDGSKDDTALIVREIADKNPNKMIFKSIENSGPSTARNIGIDLASGDYICFLDADDRYIPTLFFDLAMIIQGEDICFFGWEERLVGNERKVFSYEDRYKYLERTITGKEAAILKFRHEIWLCNCNEVYSLSLLKNHNIRYKEGVYSGEDSNFIYKCLLNAQSVISLKGDFFINYIRQDSLMHGMFSTRCLTEIDACKDLCDYVCALDMEQLYKEMAFTLYYNSRIYVAKRIARSLKWFQILQFSRKCKKYIPKIKINCKLLMPKKERWENRLFRFKILFFWVYKFATFRKER